MDWKDENERLNEKLTKALDREGLLDAVSMLGLMVPLDKVGTDYRELLIEYADRRAGKNGCAIVRGPVGDLERLMLRQVEKDDHVRRYSGPA